MVAVAHTLLVIVYHLLKRGEAYSELVATTSMSGTAGTWSRASCAGWKPWARQLLVAVSPPPQHENGLCYTSVWTAGTTEVGDRLVPRVRQAV